MYYESFYDRDKTSKTEKKIIKDCNRIKRDHERSCKLNNLWSALGLYSIKQYNIIKIVNN